VVPDLDGVLTDPDRRQTVLRAARRALAKLESFGDPISASTLNAVRPARAESRFQADLGADLFLRPAREFVRLLE
jgi:hypothetical protein